MSIAALNWALRTDTSGNDKVILIVLADCCDEDFTCFPSQEYLAELGRISIRAVRDVLNRLRDSGLVVWETRNSETTGYRSSNRYVLQAAESAGRPTGNDTPSNRQTVAVRSEPPRTKREKEIPLPSDWEPTAEHRARASKAGINIDREVERFKAHAEAHARRAVRWNAAFTQWLINAEDRKVVPFPQRAAPPAPRYDTPEEVERKRLQAIERSKRGSIVEHPPLPELPLRKPKDTRIDPWA